MKNLTKKIFAVILALVIAFTYSVIQGTQIYSFAEKETPAAEASAEDTAGVQDEELLYEDDADQYTLSEQDVPGTPDGWFEENGNKYYYKDGVPLTGYQKIGKKYYGFDETGVMLTGFVNIDGQPYFFKTTGVGASKGWKYANKYYCKGNGVLKTGYAKVKQGKKKYWFYFDKETGLITKGYVFDTVPYYFDSKGRGMKKGWITDGAFKFYSTGNGKLAVGYTKISKNKYYGFAETGEMLTGEQVIDGKLYLFDENGKGAVKGWFDENTKYCKGNGKAVTGYYVIDDQGYFFEADPESPDFGRFVKDKEVIYDGKLYLIGPDGLGVPEGWYDENTRYCIGKGEMAVGYVKAADPGTGTVYGWYFNKDTESEDYATYVKDQYIIDGKKHYMMDADGHGIEKGWFETEEGNKYCIGYGEIKTGWLALDNKAYFFDKGTAVQVKGKKVGNINIPDTGVLTKKAYALGIKTLDKKGWTLRAAYNFSYKLKYYDRWYRKDTVEEYAIRGFEQHRGNCYVMASTFCVMARLLGYDVKQVRGHVGAAPHSWTEVKYNGKWKVFDPNFRNETGRNGWNIYYGKKGTWRYKKGSTVKMAYK